MLAEIRIESLGAISAATAEFDRGLTVLTGETGTGKTMVVTGLHLLGGARADATRVRSGADRAVVEGRFTTAELGDGGGRQVDEILDSSGAERDDDGSVIAARSVSRDGPSRAYLGGRSVPAKSLSTFTTELLALHGQNDQLRLMRPDEQRAALDRFVDVEHAAEALPPAARRVAGGPPRPRRPQATGRELAQEADRLKFGAQRDRRRRTRNPARTTRWSPTSAGCPNSTRCAKPRRRRGRRCPARSTTPAPEARRRPTASGRRRSALEATDDSALRALAEQLGEALDRRSVTSSTELGGYLAELPSDASTLETKLARQGELRDADPQVRRRHRRRAGMGRESRDRLAQLDVSEEALAGLERRVDELEAQVVAAATELTKARTKAAKGLAKAVTAELAGLAMADAEFTVAVAPLPARADDSAPLTLPSG